MNKSIFRDRKSGPILRIGGYDDINNKGNGSFKGVGQRLGGAYEQELKEKLYSTLKSKAEINDLSEKLLAKYSEREKEF